MARSDKPSDFEVETVAQRRTRQERQLASARVTEEPKVGCDCEACKTAPRRPNRLLVNYSDVVDVAEDK